MKLTMIVMGWFMIISGALVGILDVPISSFSTGCLAVALGISLIDNGGR